MHHPLAGHVGPASDARVWLAAIVESSDDAIISKDLNGIVTSWNRGAELIFGYTAEEMIGHPIRVIAAPGLEQEMQAILERIRGGDRVHHFETRRRRKDGRVIDISLTVSPIRDADGRIVGASKIARDITDRKEAERQRQLLLAELNHRVKNTLAIVLSIAAQTQRTAPRPEDFVTALHGRLRAMASSHDLLVTSFWRGVDLRQLIRVQIGSADAPEDRVVLSGDSAWLDANTTLALGMALHELLCNAIKFGALGKSGGRVEVNWRVESGREEQILFLSWRELGGPRISEPGGSGFGRRLVERLLTHQLGGDIRLSFEPAGAACVMKVPLPPNRGEGNYALAWASGTS